MRLVIYPGHFKNLEFWSLAAAKWMGAEPPALVETPQIARKRQAGASWGITSRRTPDWKTRAGHSGDQGVWATKATWDFLSAWTGGLSCSPCHLRGPLLMERSNVTNGTVSQTFHKSVHVSHIAEWVFPVNGTATSLS